MPFAGSRPRATLSTLAVVLLFGSPLAAQTPVLRVTGSANAGVDGVSLQGAAAYPVRSLENLGFTLRHTPDGVTAAMGGDTLRFWATSPFFRAGESTHQLAFPAGLHGGALYLPEQFFISWLPAWRGERFAFEKGLLIVSPGAAAVAETTSPAPAPRVDTARRPADRTRVVVIDAGHGGRDPGKIAPNGLREKDVTLLLARRLGELLAERGYEVHFTRTSDTLIALHDRPRLANEWRGDRPVAVFLSIHANAFHAESVRGFETFFLSEARTEDERRVAAMENEVVRFEKDAPPNGDRGLGQILNNLRSDFLMRSSHELAATVQDRLAEFHPGPNRGVKRGELIVLIGSIMPAVLIETGFLSNRDEAGLLGTESFQRKLVTGIADAVEQFFDRNEHLWVYEP